MEIVKINFTPDRIKYILFENIKKSVLENNGIIFGGFVRDMIISDHYKTIYNSNNQYDIHKFWNKFHQPETGARALVAKDIDICMYTEDDVSNFLIALQNEFNKDAGYSNVSSSDLTVTDENCYFNLPIKMHKKINYKITVGKIPYVYSGVELSFDFDIIIPMKSTMLPPFNKLDFLSNVFVLNKQGVIMSHHTGTIIDKMSILQKQKISSIIMNDIVEFRTQFCMKHDCKYNNFTCGNFNYNNKVFHRINKMLFRNFKWNITNLPFLICDYKKFHYSSNNNCCICLSNFKNNDRLVKIYIDNSTKTEKVCSNMSIAHDKCLFKYFETQLETSKTDGLVSSDSFEFKCPSRNVINFKLYSENISKIISDKMNVAGWV